MFDLDAYLNRIVYLGPRTPTLETLRAVQRQHTEHIAFENLDPLLRRPVKLDEASLQEKLVYGGRGGYCFEQNGLLQLALSSLGFRVSGLAARVLWNLPAGAVAPRSHMLLRVALGGETQLVDVGFGGTTPTGPLRLEPDITQETPHEPFRLLQEGDDFTLQMYLREHWRNVYRFDLREQLPPDYEVSNWYVSNHPNSHFVTGLIASRTEPGYRYALRDNELAVHALNGGSERRIVDTAAELREVLEHTFLLQLPDSPELTTTLEQLTRQPT